jgi:hypothetical protein
LAEDEDIELDSEEYRKWRSGGDNDKYASSKTPTETGSRSGSYRIPKDDDDEYALPGEDESGSSGSWLDGDLNWALIIAGFVIFALVSATIFAFVMTSNESDTKPSEWPETEGTIIEQTNSETFIYGEFCEDENEDGWEDDWECWKEFVFAIDLKTQYSVDNDTYQIVDYVEFWDKHRVDVLKQDGGENEERLFENFTDYWNEEAANGSISLNSTINLIYNPENPKEAYSEFVELPGDPTGFIGYFFLCCGGMLCLPIVIVGVVIGWAKNAATGGYRDNRMGRWGRFGGGYFGNNRHHQGGSKRRHTPTRRSGGGGGRSSGGSRSGGGRSGGGSRRR